jgi:hypothetical protein
MSTLFSAEAQPIARTAPRAGIRPLSENDLEQVTALYRRVFGDTVHGSPAFLKRIFFESPWRDDSLTSLAYFDERGRITGCLGVMPRPMMFRGRAIRAAIGHHFMVDPSKRGSSAGLDLARRFIRGPQDLSLAEGNESSRRIWEFLGGVVSPLYSLCWTRALRPAQYSLQFLKHRGFPASAALTLQPICRAADATLQLFPQRAFRFHPPAALTDHLDTVTMLACLSAFASNRALHPVYDRTSLEWLVRMLNEKRHRGTLHQVAVRTHSGQPLGWYLYYLGASNVAEVLQVGGNDDKIRDVLDHLLYHAWQRGAVAATGPMEPRLCGALSENHCAFHRPVNCWMLLHSHDSLIVNAIHAGDAFLSRLEGEWWIAA